MAQATEQPIGVSPEPSKRMGRKKIQISRIVDERNRQVTFTKRKFGLMKKAYELSILCDCEIALIIFNGANKLFQYASTDMDKVLLKYTEYNEPHESRTNKDIIDALNKKEHKGCESPEMEGDMYSNSLSIEEKYNRMNEEYQRALHHQNQMRPSPMSPYPPSGGLSPGGMPVHNSPYMNHSLQAQMGQHSPAISSPGLLQPPPGPGNLSPRPNSTGNMVDISHSPTPNGYHRASPCSSPGMMVNKGMTRQSPPIHNRQQGNHPGPPRIMVPDTRNNMMNAEMPRSPNVPAVSLTTPSITGGGSGYNSPNPTYQTNDYGMNPGDTMGGGGNMQQQNYSPHPSPLHWSQGQGSLTTGVPPGGGHQMAGNGGQVTNTGANHSVSPLLINTMNHNRHNMNMNIKSEPISPPRESTTPSGHHTLRPPSQQGQSQGHLSPGHISPHLSHSNCSSPTANLHPTGPSPQQQTVTDFDGPMMKRPRLEGWTT